MKNILLLFVALLFMSTITAGSWRPGEKQVLLTVNTPRQANIIKHLKLSFDVLSNGQLRAYVIPGELTKLENAGISYKIEIDDLNVYSLSQQNADDSWHQYQDIINLEDSLVQAFPDICKKYVFGQSLGGRDLTALKISDNVDTDENEAEVMFDGGIHGDEYCGPENITRFARDLCIAYGNDPDITNLIDNREIWLYPMVNPDGRENVVRYNNAGVDLNRDWCYMWDSWGGSPGPCSQPESKALRECMYHNQFVVHTTYHGGDECVSMPWSYRPDQPHDWNHINQLGGLYSSSSLYSNLPYYQGYSGMYAINGSTKDANYGMMGSISWSMEISYDKKPSTSQISLYYQRNYPAMMTMVEYAGYGLEGTITDAVTGDPVAAAVFVNDFIPCQTDPDVGDYHKYVLAGTYDITVVANGYETQTVTGVSVSSQNATVTNIQLQPEEGQFAYRLTGCQIPNNNYADEGWTPAVIGAPDMVNFSIGKNGWCVLDMQYPISDGPGPDIMVYEGDATPEGYTCYAGETMDGPWMSMGTGNGTSEFDLANAGLLEAQYIKIEDDGDGSANASDAGFDLDAVAALATSSGVYIAMYEYEIDDSNGNNNGKIDPGETVDIMVSIKNNGDVTAENISGEIATASPWLTIETGTASFGTIAQGEMGTGTFTVSADAATPTGQPADIDLDVEANSGTYTNSYTMSVVIGHIPVVVVDMDPNHNSASDIMDAIEANNLSVEMVTGVPSDLSLYTSVFLCLGIYSDNTVLTSGDGQALADYLNGGGNLYMEGGDTWYFDDQTAVHPMFNINATSDGSSDLGTINGMSGTFTEGMSFGYSGDNNWIDHIEAISPAFTIFQNQSPSYGTAVAHDAGTYKTIGASHEFGGLDDGSSPSTKADLMAAYLDFFGISSTLQAQFSANETAICESGTVDFTDLSTGDVTTWEWEFEGGSPATSTFQNPMVAYFNEGTFDVTLTVSDGTDSQTITMTDYITVSTSPETPAKPEGPELSWSAPGSTDDYTTTGSVNALSYEWMLDPADAGELTTNGTECTVDWTDYWNGIAYLSVKAINDCGESEYSENLLIQVLIESIPEVNGQVLQVFPNPVSNKINLILTNGEYGPASVSLTDNKGVQVYLNNDTKFDGNAVQIDVSELSQGIYFLHLFNDSMNILRKIVIKK